MTGTDDPTGASPATGPTAPDDHEALELGAYLAAENVANDYHSDGFSSDHGAG